MSVWLDPCAHTPRFTSAGPSVRVAALAGGGSDQSSRDDACTDSALYLLHTFPPKIVSERIAEARHRSDRCLSVNRYPERNRVEVHGEAW